MASELGNLSIMKALIDAGADVDTQTILGDTPLFYGAHNQEAIGCLIAAGADENEENEDGQTYLEFEKEWNRIASEMEVQEEAEGMNVEGDSILPEPYVRESLLFQCACSNWFRLLLCETPRHHSREENKLY